MNVKQTLDFEGGPLDGATFTVDGDVRIGDLLIAIPRKTERDSDSFLTGVTVHRYTLCNSTYSKFDEESQTPLNPCHYMGHVDHANRTMEELNAFCLSPHKST